MPGPRVCVNVDKVQLPAVHLCCLLDLSVVLCKAGAILRESVCVILRRNAHPLAQQQHLRPDLLQLMHDLAVPRIVKYQRLVDSILNKRLDRLHVPCPAERDDRLGHLQQLSRRMYRTGIAPR